MSAVPPARGSITDAVHRYLSERRLLGADPHHPRGADDDDVVRRRPARARRVVDRADDVVRHARRTPAEDST